MNPRGTFFILLVIEVGGNVKTIFLLTLTCYRKSMNVMSIYVKNSVWIRV